MRFKHPRSSRKYPPPQILINQHVILSASWPCGENMTAAFREGHGGLVAVITLPL